MCNDCLFFSHFDKHLPKKIVDPQLFEDYLLQISFQFQEFISLPKIMDAIDSFHIPFVLNLVDNILWQY
jgi:hypothetical protein